MIFLKKVKRIIKKFLLDLLFPIQCLGCGRDGEWLCAECSRPLVGSLAVRPLVGSHTDSSIVSSTGSIKTSQLIIPNLNQIFIAGNYENRLLARLIKKFKYNFLEALGETLSRLLADYWSSQIWLLPNSSANDVLLIPIPLSKERQHWRGFNQAEILARQISQEFDYKISLDLTKVKNTKPQANLEEKTRLTNVAGCFQWSGDNLGGRTVIIIDDVVTTGATINEAAGCLRSAGAKKIYGLVLAKG